MIESFAGYEVSYGSEICPDRNWMWSKAYKACYPLCLIRWIVSWFYLKDELASDLLRIIDLS